MIQPTTKEIDGLEITVQPWPARRAFQNQLILGKLLAPSLKDLGLAVMGSKNPNKDNDSQENETTAIDAETANQETTETTSEKTNKPASADIDLGLIGSAFSKILMTVDPKKSDELILMLLSEVFVKGKKLTPELIDTYFMGRFETLYKIFGLVLEVNFGNFLSKIGIGRLIPRN